MWLHSMDRQPRTQVWGSNGAMGMGNGVTGMWLIWYLKTGFREKQMDLPPLYEMVRNFWFYIQRGAPSSWVTGPGSVRRESILHLAFTALHAVSSIDRSESTCQHETQAWVICSLLTSKNSAGKPAQLAVTTCSKMLWEQRFSTFKDIALPQFLSSVLTRKQMIHCSNPKSQSFPCYGC